MELDDNARRTFASLGMRGSFGSIFEYVVDQGNFDWKIVTADTLTSAGLARLKSKVPHNFIECGIAEQAAVAIATGIAHEGKLTFVGSFAPFIVGRAWEQIRLAAYMDTDLTIFGFGAGIGLSYLGYTHCSLEDVSLISTIPNTTIYEPATPMGMLESLKDSCALRGVKYIRMTGDGPLDRKLLDSRRLNRFVSVIEASARTHKKSIEIGSGDCASRVISENLKSEKDTLVVEKFGSEEMDIILHYISDRTNVRVIHESYGDYLVSRLGLKETASHVEVIAPDRKFSKPGDFSYCAKELGFNVAS